MSAEPQTPGYVTYVGQRITVARGAQEMVRAMSLLPASIDARLKLVVPLSRSECWRSYPHSKGGPRLITWVRKIVLESPTSFRGLSRGWWSCIQSRTTSIHTQKNFEYIRVPAFP